MQLPELSPLVIAALVAGVLFLALLFFYFRQKATTPGASGKEMSVYLWYPTQNRLEERKVKTQPDGTVLFNELQVQVVLDPALRLATGQIFIDAERGVQIRYEGLKGWVGIDGRYTYAAQVKRDARDLQTRGWDLSKYAWPITITIGIVFAAFVGMGIIAVS